jgi:hypothetical protein
MVNYTVKLNFNDGTNNYDLPLVYSISDPQQGMKATVIPGTRGDGSVVIPGGKKSQLITVKGYLVNHNGYAALTTDIAEMRTKVTTNVATLTLKHFDSGWVTDWAYQIRRIDEIKFSESLRFDAQEYEISFIVTSY